MPWVLRRLHLLHNPLAIQQQAASDTIFCHFIWRKLWP